MVGIDSDRQIPADRSIYVGEYANFNLVMFPVDYECVESDFSCDTAGVTLSLLEGYTNVLKIDVADTVTPGTEVNVFFESQKIMHVTAVAQPVTIESVDILDKGTETVPFRSTIWEGDGVSFVPVFNKPYDWSLDDFSVDNPKIMMSILESSRGKAVALSNDNFEYINNGNYVANIFFKGTKVATLSLVPFEVKWESSEWAASSKSINIQLENPQYQIPQPTEDSSVLLRLEDDIRSYDVEFSPFVNGRAAADFGSSGSGYHGIMTCEYIDNGDYQVLKFTKNDEFESHEFEYVNITAYRIGDVIAIPYSR